MEEEERVLIINESEGAEAIPPDGDETLKQTKKHFSKIGFAYFWGTVVIFAVQYLVSWIAQVFFPQAMSSHDAGLILSTVSMYLLGMSFLTALLWRIPKTALPRHKMGIGKWFIAFFMSYAIMYASNIIGVVLTGVIGIAKGDRVSNPMVDVVMGISPLTALILTVICAPLVEEFIFRRLLIERTVRYGEKTAILLSGLIFGLFHGNLNQFAYAFVLGVFFGFIYVKTGKLIYTIGLHMAINFMGSIPGMLMMRSEVFTALTDLSDDTDAIMKLVVDHMAEIAAIFLYLILILVILLAGIICWALSAKKMKCAPGTVVIPKGQRFKTVILNVGMSLYGLFWIVQIVRQLLE